MDATLLLAAGGLLALALGHGIFSDDDDDSDSILSAPDLPEDAEGTNGDDVITQYDPSRDDGVLLAGAGDDLVELDDLENMLADLGPGDDTITGEDYDNVEVRAGEGDDLVRVDDPTGGLFDLGPGNDTITGDDYRGVKITAGDGDDTVMLEESARVVIHGGAGNDDITLIDGTLNAVELGGGQNSVIHGGAGDDHIRLVDTEAAGHRYDENDVLTAVGGPLLTGGEGDDIFEISLAPDENAQTLYTGEIVGDEVHKVASYSNAASITDFEPGTDRLVIDPTTYAGDATYTGYEIVQDPTTGHAEIVFNYTRPGYPDGLAMSVQIHGGKITEADIEIIAPA